VKFLVLLGASLLGVSGVAAAEPVEAINPLTPWIDLLRTGGSLTVAVGAVWFALKKDNEAKALADKHAQELGEANKQVVTLVTASMAQSAAVREALQALTLSLAAVEKAIDRQGKG
jgi:hypothetical protein